MYPKELLKLLLQDGWNIKRQRGSHIIIEKDDKIEVIPMHHKDLKMRNTK